MFKVIKIKHLQVHALRASGFPFQEALNSFEAVAREWHATVHVAKVSSGHAARTLVNPRKA